MTQTFETFYERELTVQVRRAVLLVGSREAAEDLVHDAMIEVHRRWASLDHPAAFLDTVVVNRCRDHLRRRLVRVRAVARLRPPDPVDAVGDVLDDALARLPFNQRAAVVLRFYEQMTGPEIAQVLGCAEGSVGPWIDRALRTLREALR